jgi:hypothetical protein
LQAKEAFFALLVRFDEPGSATLRHGESGQVRLSLRPEPLLRQWSRKLSQLIQRRYGW